MLSDDFGRSLVLKFPDTRVAEDAKAEAECNDTKSQSPFARLECSSVFSLSTGSLGEAA